MTIYSGLDADAIDNSQLNPNDEITELLLQLKAPFRTTPDTSCAPNCRPPPPGSAAARPRQLQVWRSRVPTHWVHGRVPIWLKCTPASGITARYCCGLRAGARLRRGEERSDPLPGHRRDCCQRITSPDRPWSSSTASGWQQAPSSSRSTTRRRACSTSETGGSGGGLSVPRQREVEDADRRRRCRATGAGSVARHRLNNATLPGSVRHARLILRDRAGNTIVRKLSW